VLASNSTGQVFEVGVKERRIVATLPREVLGIYFSLEFLGSEPDGKVTLGGFSTLAHLDLERALGSVQKYPSDVFMEYLSADGAVAVGRTVGDHTLHVYGADGKEIVVLAPAAKPWWKVW